MNLAAIAAGIKLDAEIMRAYREHGSIRGAARALGTTIHQVQRVVDPAATAEHIAKTAERQRNRLPAEWADAKCTICHTRPGRMYCAMCCDGEGCADEATPERLADYQRYNVARRKHNATATREERRISRRRSEEAVNSVRRRIG